MPLKLIDASHYVSTVLKINLNKEKKMTNELEAITEIEAGKALTRKEQLQAGARALAMAKLQRTEESDSDTSSESLEEFLDRLDTLDAEKENLIKASGENAPTELNAHTR